LIVGLSMLAPCAPGLLVIAATGGAAINVLYHSKRLPLIIVQALLAAVGSGASARSPG
jgi:hypothetical protein